MSSVLIKNIKLLAGVREDNFLLRGKQLAKLPTIADAFLIIQDGLIAAYGKMDDFVYRNSDFGRQVDALEQTILPAWCDSHTHLVFAHSREEEFIDKIKGLSYAEIAARGGGILNSAKKLNAASENELFNLACDRLDEVSKQGTGAIEIKTGYGLTTEGELKMLRVIKRLREKSSAIVGNLANCFPRKRKLSSLTPASNLMFLISTEDIRKDIIKQLYSSYVGTTHFQLIHPVPSCNHIAGLHAKS